MSTGTQSAYVKLRRRAGWAFRAATASIRVTPDFLIVGAQKGGTTSLYEHLCRSRHVLRARDKEIHYFDWGYNYYRGGRWYQACFPAAPRVAALEGIRRVRPVTGEASPYYLFHPLAPARVAADLPRVRIIALLRNPIDRAYSHYRHARRAGWERGTFAEAIAGEIERTPAASRRILADPRHDVEEHELRSYLSQGLYAEHLARWWTLPGMRDRTLVLQSEPYFRDPATAAARALEFLGLPPDPLPCGPLNVGGYGEEIDAGLRRQLRNFFAPHNEALFGMLGERYDWE